MNQNGLPRTLSVFIILMAVVACVLPGQATSPAPGTDPLAIESAVAGTAQAAEQQTQQADPVPATATMAPTDVPSSTPKIGVSGTSLVVREDQSSLFIDYRAGIQLVIPPGWMAVRLNEEEYFEAFTSDVVLQNKEIWDSLTMIQDLDPVYLRLDAIDVRPGHIPDGILTYISVIFEPGDMRTLEKWEQAERAQHRSYADFKFISAKYPQTSNGTRVLVIEQSWTDNQVDTVYYRGVFFSLPTGTMVLDLYTNSAYKDGILPEFEQVVDSLTLLNEQ